MRAWLRTIRNSLIRVLGGLRTWPGLCDWLLTAGVFATFAAAASAVGFGTGLFRYAPSLDNGLLRVALIAFLLPAMGEEVVFRGLLIDQRSGWVRQALALAAFLTWHPVNAALFFPEAVSLFGDARFLVIAGLLGVCCQYLWRRTGSLWPPIVLHWLAVVLWKALIEGPRLF